MEDSVSWLRTVSEIRAEAGFGALRTEEESFFSDTADVKHSPGGAKYNHDQRSHGRRYVRGRKQQGGRYVPKKVVAAAAKQEIPEYFENWQPGTVEEFAVATGSTPKQKADAERIYGEKIFERIQATYEYEDINGTSSVVTSLKLDDQGRLLLSGKIYNDKGRYDGDFIRSWSKDSSGVHVNHELFGLRDTAQGTGFGKAYYQHVEQQYIKSGVTTVRMTANLDVGGYAWARMGYDFQNNTDRKLINSAIKNRWRKSWGPYPLPDNASPWQLASLMTPDGRQFGKQLMLGTQWEGIKSLNPNSEGFKIGQLYYQQR